MNPYARAMARSTATTPAHDGADLEEYRRGLTGYCYRMLGSGFEAEDAVQETLVRAWRGQDRLKEPAALKSWLYRIAHNICLDTLGATQRRARPVDLTAAGSADASLPLATRPEECWIEPVPDALVLVDTADPARQALESAGLRLAFVAALQHLPARQRAVLILREVLGWQAAEVAELLETSVASVNSSLQRARARIEATSPSEDETPTLLYNEHRELLGRYVSAFEAFDIDALVGLLHEDATLSMPPFELWLRGPAELRSWWLGLGCGCRGSLLVRVSANGLPAFGQYRPSGPDGAYEPWAVQAIESSAGRITGIVSFLDTARLFPLFGLPATIDR